VAKPKGNAGKKNISNLPKYALPKPKKGMKKKGKNC